MALRRLSVLLACVPLWIATTAFAQPVAAAAVPSAVVHDLVVRLSLDGRGRSERTLRLRATLQDSSAVSGFGQLSFPYLPEHERVTLRRLWVTKADGRRVDLSQVRTEDLTNPGAGGMPDARALHVAVPGLVAGDTLEYEVHYATIRPVVEGQFWAEHTFMRAAVVERERLEIEAPAALALLVRAAPDAGARVAERIERGVRTVVFEHTNPTVQIEDFSKPGVLEQALRRPPDVLLSTQVSWDDVGRWFGSLVALRSTATAALRAKAAELTAGATSEQARVEALAAFVGEQVRFLSLPLGARRYEPRPAGDVLSTLYGDCKDKHVLLAALGEAVGLDVRPALLHSLRSLVEDAPSVSQFDHVVSVVRLPDGSDVWVDTTAQVYPAGALPPPLRGRRALVIDAARAAAGGAGTSRIVDTPESVNFVNESTVEVKGAVAPTGEIAATVVQILQGDSALGVKLAVRQAGIPAITAIVEQTPPAGGSAELSPVAGSVTVTGTDQRSTPVTLSYRGTRRLEPDTLKKRWSFRVPMPALTFEKVRAREGDPPRPMPITLGAPGRTVMRATFELPEGTTATAPVGVSLDNALASHVSRYRIEGRTVLVERESTTKVFRVVPEQFPTFEAFCKAVEDDQKKVFVVTALPRATAPATDTADALSEAGSDALEALDFTGAERLLRRAVEKDPAHEWAWNNLGRALVGQRRWAEAVEAYRRQLAVVPAHEYAHGNLAYALLTLGEHNEAEASARRHLEIEPLDSWGWRVLSAALLSQGRQTAAVEALEAAAAMKGASPTLLQLLARAHLFAGQTAKALAVIDRMLAEHDSALAFGQAASELALLGVAVGRIPRYVERTFALASKELETVVLTDPPEEWEAPMLGVALASFAMGARSLAEGRQAEAQRWLSASWRLFRIPMAGQMLAASLATSGREREGRMLMAQVAALPGAGDEVRAALATLVPDADLRAQVTADAREAEARDARQQVSLKGSGSASVLLSVGGDGRVDEVRFTGGDESLRVTVQGLVGLSLDLGRPPGRAIRGIRGATLSCGDARGCALVLQAVSPELVPHPARAVRTPPRPQEKTPGGHEPAGRDAAAGW